jgi:hypothetical protein
VAAEARVKCSSVRSPQSAHQAWWVEMTSAGSWWPGSQRPLFAAVMSLPMTGLVPVSIAAPARCGNVAATIHPASGTHSKQRMEWPAKCWPAIPFVADERRCWHGHAQVAQQTLLGNQGISLIPWLFDSVLLLPPSAAALTLLPSAVSPYRWDEPAGSYVHSSNKDMHLREHLD